jgi:uncharacterized C2H2 Zn-finger protein
VSWRTPVADRASSELPAVCGRRLRAPSSEFVWRTDADFADNRNAAVLLHGRSPANDRSAPPNSAVGLYAPCRWRDRACDGPLRAGAGDEVDAAALTCPDCGRVFKSSAGIGTHLKLATKSCVRNQKKVSQQVRTSPRRVSTTHF